FYDSLASVIITGVPNPSYNFQSWTGTGTGSYSGNTNARTITLGGPVTETASFVLAPIDVTVQSNPAGRTFTVDGIQYTGSQAFVWSATAAHTIATTTPQ